MTTKKRVEVQGLGEAPSVKPVGLPSYQYGITQLQAPKPQVGTSKLLKFAGDLSKVGKLSESYLGFRQQEAIREQQIDKAQAAQFQEEQREQEKFDQVLLKQHLNTVTLPSLQQQAESLVDIQKYTKREQTSQAIDEAISKEWESLSETLGGDVADSLASKALWNSVVPGVKAKLMSQYETNREGFTIASQGQDLITQLGQATVNGSIDPFSLELIAEQREAIMVEQGITDPATRQKILLDGYTAQLDTLITKDKFKDARSFVTAMELMKVKGRRVFGSAQSIKTINDFITTLESAESKQGTVSKATQQQNFGGFYEAALIGLHGKQKFGGALEPNQISALRTSLQTLSSEFKNNPKALDEVVSSIVESRNPVAAYENKLSELSQSKDAPDLALELYMGNRSRLNSIREDVLVRPRQPLNLSGDYKKQQEEEFLEWAEGQTDKPPTVKDFILKQKKDYVSWDTLDQLGIEAEERGAILNSTYYKGVSSSIGKMIKNETETYFAEDYLNTEAEVEEIYKGTSGREFQRSATERMQEALKNAAPKDDTETIKLVNQLERQEKERWLRIVKAKDDALEMKPESQISVEGEVQRAELEVGIKQVRTKELKTFGKDVAYESLMRVKRGAPVSSIKRQTIEDDRIDMEAKNFINQQRLSYYNFGLSSYSRDGVQKVSKLDLDTDDVVLFGSRSEAEIKLNEWADILTKDTEGVQLTAEEKEIAEQYIELGITNVDDLLRFGIVQLDLIDRPRKPL